MLIIDVLPYILFCSIVLIMLVMFYKLMYKRKAKDIFLKSGIRDIDQMDGRQFEFFLEALFIKLGYKAAKSFYKANEAWVITNSTYTSSAKQLARACDVKLLDRSSLQEFIVQVNPEQKPADIRKSVEPATRKCPKCGEELVSRTHDGRVFLGCSSFPQCRHTEKVAN
ncbi:topoisomerase DNA-binding C4 zinc finger domain-containing protein [Bacillus cereus]